MSSRRNFMKTSAAIGAGYFVAAGVQPKESLAANEKIAFASIGVGGKGTSDSNDAGRSGDMVAICDIDDNRLDNAAKRNQRRHQARPTTPQRFGFTYRVRVHPKSAATTHAEEHQKDPSPPRSKATRLCKLLLAMYGWEESQLLLRSLFAAFVSTK